MADPLFCPWLINAPCLKSEIWAAWAQALLSGVGIIAAAWLPNRTARMEKQDRFYAVISLMMEASKRMYLVADCIALHRLPLGFAKPDDELVHLTAALDAIPAHELPQGALLYSIKGVRREVAAMNDLHRRITSDFNYSDLAWGDFRKEAHSLLVAMQIHMDHAFELGDFTYGGALRRAAHRLKSWRRRRAAAARRTRGAH